MSGRKDSIDLWLAALQERLNEDARSKLPTLDKEVLAVKLNELVHQVRGPSEIPFGMNVYRLEVSVDRRQNRRYSDGQWIVSPNVADFLDLRVTNDQWDIILSMEARMDDRDAMKRLFQFIQSTRMSVLTIKFSEHVYTGKLKSHLLRALEAPYLECLEIIYTATIPDIVLEFLTSVAKNQRRCYFRQLSILGAGGGSNRGGGSGHSIGLSDSSDTGSCEGKKAEEEETMILTQDVAQKIAEMLLHFRLKELTLEGVRIVDDVTALRLADGIQRCKSLEALNMLGSPNTHGIGNWSVQQIIGQSILHNESLKKLKLSP